MRLRYGPPTDLDEDFAGIVGRMKDLHTITRSTVPLLAWWRDHALDKLIPGTDLAHATARFEYAVPARCTACHPKPGRGKASMTDVMVLFDDQAIAIEGKYTEPQYERVSSWRTKGRDRGNREAVLEHWCHLIETFTAVRIDRDTVGGLVYQTVHRTASACAAAPAGGNAHVTYLVFARSGEGNDYAADLGNAARVLDPAAKIGFTLVEVPTTHGRDFDEVKRQVEAAQVEDRVDILGDALVAKREIYCFGDPKRTPIR